MTDCLKYIARNTSLLGGGVSPKERYYDLITKEPETRSAIDIVKDVINKTGIEVIEDGR